MSKERRKHKAKQHEHGEELPDEHPGAVAQKKKKKKDIIGTLIIIAIIAGAIYVTTQGG